MEPQEEQQRRELLSRSEITFLKSQNDNIRLIGFLSVLQIKMRY